MDKILTPIKELAASFGGAQSAAEIWAVFAGLGIIALVAAAVAGVIALFYLIVDWRIYKKGGCPGIACLIPIWNVWCIFKILYGHGWLILIPGVNILLSLIAPFRLSWVFEHRFFFALGLIILPWLFLPILAFGSNYCGPNN